MAKEKKERSEVFFTTEEVKRFWDRAVKGLKTLGDEAVEIYKRGEEEVVKVSKAGKLRLEIVGLKRKREEKFKELGAKAYKLGIERKIDQPSVKKLSQGIKKIEKDIKDKETRIKTLRQAEKKASR